MGQRRPAVGERRWSSRAARQASGVVWKVVEDGALDAAAWELADRLATLQPAVVREIKSVLHKVGLAAFDQALAEESGAQRRLQSAAG